MNLKHREGKPLSDYSQEERIAVLEPVARLFDADWRILYGELELFDLTADKAVAAIRKQYEKAEKPQS